MCLRYGRAAACLNCLVSVTNGLLLFVDCRNAVAGAAAAVRPMGKKVHALLQVCLCVREEREEREERERERARARERETEREIESEPERERERETERA